MKDEGLYMGLHQQRYTNQQSTIRRTLNTQMLGEDLKSSTEMERSVDCNQDDDDGSKDQDGVKLRRQRAGAKLGETVEAARQES